MNQAGSGVHLHLFENVSQVILYGALTDKKLFCNLGILVTSDDIGRYFGFSFGETAILLNGLIIDFRM